MADENGAAEAQASQPDEFAETLGGTPSEAPVDVGTPEPSGTPAFDPGVWNAERDSLDEVPEAARGVAEAFQRRLREMSNGIADKVGTVRQYEQELIDAKAEIQTLKAAQETPAGPAAPTHIPGQNANAIAESMGVDSRNSTQQSLQSLSTVSDIVDHHPISGEVAALKAEVASLRESSGMASDYVTGEQDRAYQAEYTAAVDAHGKEMVDNVISNYGDMRGRPGLDGSTLTVDSLVAMMTGKAAARGAEVQAQAAAARNGAVSAAGGMAVTSGLSDDGSATQTDADVDAFFNTNF